MKFVMLPKLAFSPLLCSLSSPISAESFLPLSKLLLANPSAHRFQIMFKKTRKSLSAVRRRKLIDVRPSQYALVFPLSRSHARSHAQGSQSSFVFNRSQCHPPLVLSVHVSSASSLEDIVPLVLVNCALDCFRDIIEKWINN